MLLQVPGWLWAATIAALIALLAVDLTLAVRRPHAVGVREATAWLVFYFGLAVIFAVGVWYFGSAESGIDFVTGYLTEYSLSVDNLFVFVVILSTFAVPAVHQQRVLLFGIVIALVLRAALIFIGGAAINQFSWVFWIFGGFLVFTAVQLARQRETSHEYQEGALVRLLRRRFRVTEDYVGGRSLVRVDGKLWLTPMFVVMVAVGSADLLFAVDSIPAIYGITQDTYLVFAANAFALLGLRQLYFLIGHLLDRLVYLSYGLAVILGFIGIKLVFHALKKNELPFINSGQPVTWVPEISNWLSLGVVAGVLVVTAVASLVATRRRSV
ncbi:TerC/Alx family metal homeostasis membrane protein [Crossiella cryophila]|uniref:Tellurite resistance protein TerC n=1 Tax=Crossiella cryophila TaxID=43355 RepID=A0A7W7FWN2_9PSEU|nr:TerC/Alx family metal homeostasis membrane protein [Crossiella cryophila]MBB4679778.1 tellurite resistance protein TerC [Crossiella cryophila]